MGKTKNNKQDNTCNFPYSNEIKEMKDKLKMAIDDMSDEDFIDFYSSLICFFSALDDTDCDEGWEDEAEKFYNSKQ